MAGESDVLWQQSVRISTPANARRRSRRASYRPDPAQVRFRIFRSFLLNRFAFAGFILCYWFLYLEATGFRIEPSATEQTAQSAPITAVQTPGATANRKTEIVRAKPIQPQSLTFTAPDEYKGKIVQEVNSVGTEKVVALTFDDGPWPSTTEKILEILKQNNIKGTFYWVGIPLQNNPEIAKKVVAAGHAIGNHTWQHLMNDMDEATAAQELGNAAKLMYDITGVKTTLMRPPGGNLSGSLATYAQKLGYTVTLWSADSEDYYVSAPIVVDNVLKNTRPGGIVLMHDGGGDRNPTVEALPQVIDTLKRRGYRFVTVPELLAMKAQRQSTVWQKGSLEGRSH
ncbi:MAG: polysaccharide deacetylase family protein [Pantanalinema sp. GBBB05]|nr:polysaccharide deacetylase family protein [Pantanalinema sp. GBBB05]